MIALDNCNDSDNEDKYVWAAHRNKLYVTLLFSKSWILSEVFSQLERWEVMKYKYFVTVLQ